MDDYAARGKGFGANDEMQVAQIADRDHPVIRPRVDKNADEQRQRSVKRAEVFTPSWICNKQNNLVDATWFGWKKRDSSPFNTEIAKFDPETEFSWNIWQMDGIKYVVLMSCKPKVTKETLLDGTVETHIEECPGCSKKGNRQHFGTYCKVMDWNTGEPVEFRAIAENGGYISKKTRNAKWGSGAIDALSNQLQVELPGLRGFSAMSIRYMRLFFEAWSPCAEIQHLASVGFEGQRLLPSGSGDVRLVSGH